MKSKLPLGIGLILLLLSGTAIARQSIQADSIEVEKKQYLDVLRKQIAGKEEQPANEVFKNIRFMNRTTAGRLLNVMDFGFSRSLGVSCTHCHVPGEWEKDEKPQKQIAREMSAMAGTINRELLPNIKNLKTDVPVVNCTTCHRGQTKPALNLPN